MIDRRGARAAAALLLALTALGCGQSTPTASPIAASIAPTSVVTPPAATEPATAEPVPTDLDTGSAGTPPCLLADLKASHGIVDGAAGSRVTQVVLVSASTCSVDAFPALRLRDSKGASLISAPSSAPGAVDLVPGVGYTSDVRLANWCTPDPSFPLALAVVLGADELAVTGGSFPEEGDLPACNGDTGPRLEATAWTPTP